MLGASSVDGTALLVEEPDHTLPLVGGVERVGGRVRVLQERLELLVPVLLVFLHFGV